MRDHRGKPTGTNFSLKGPRKTGNPAGMTNNNPRPSDPGDDMIQGMASMRANKSSAQPAGSGSGRGRYQLDGGGYVRTSPSEGSEGRRHDVTVYSDDHKPQYSVSGASFGHDPETNQAKFFGGKDKGSGEVMKHTWTGKTMGGNIHQD